MKEIGGEFIVEVSKNKNNNIDRYFDFYGSEKIFFDSGRSALWYLASKIKNKVVLLPDYLCESIIIPFQLEKYEIYFYHINKDLTIDYGSIDYSLDAGIFLHMGYFGLNTNFDCDKTISYFKKKGTIVVEDITHTIFSKFRKEPSDYYICSLRKWFGIYDGAVLISNNAEKINYSNNADFIKYRQMANHLKNDYLINKTANKEYLEIYKKAEAVLDSPKEIYEISEESLQTIYKYNIKKMIMRRRKNFFLLNKKIKISFINEVFLKSGKCFVPLFFPISIKNRDKVRQIMIKNKIFTPVHWPVPNEIITKGIRQELYKNELSIPCDQRYSKSDMKRIIKIYNECED